MRKRTGMRTLRILCLGILVGFPMHGALGEDEGCEVKVSLDRIPAKVRTAILKAVGEGTLVDVGRIERNGKTFYEIEMWIGGEEYDVLFDREGEVLKRERGDEDGEDGDDADDGEDGEDEDGGVERKVSIDQVPDEVRAAILEAVGEGTLVDIGEISAPDGKTYYEIEMWLDGREYDVLFDADGKLLKREAEDDGDGEEDDDGDAKGARKAASKPIAYEAAPRKVRTAILTAMVRADGDARLLGLSEVTRGKRSCYWTRMRLGGKRLHLLFSPGGRELARRLEAIEDSGRERKVSIDQVPDGVRAAILEAVGEGTLVDIGEISAPDGKTYYEIEMWLDGREYDVLFDADGKLLKREAEDDEDEDDEDDDDDDEHDDDD